MRPVRPMPGTYRAVAPMRAGRSLMASRLSVAIRNYFRAWLARDELLSAPRGPELERLWQLAEAEWDAAPLLVRWYWRWRLDRAFAPVHRMIRDEERKRSVTL